MKQADAVLSVKELTRYIKNKLENDERLQDVWVKGEISNFTHHSSGHMYFTLKDADSRIKCIMFASHNQRLPFLPREGTKVLARGGISIYERDGQYQFYITQMQPDGIGSLYLAYEQLKRKLEEEGLFATARKKPIPRLPGAIGIITSPTGAAIRDMLITLQRRFPSVPVLLFPVLVQGTQAAPAIARAIRIMNERREVDVLIVGRGGGSLEELWAFNEEIVARSIYASAIPVISAVGHETDFTIADFVADLRAATPTAAAELAVPHYLELTQQLRDQGTRLQRGLLRRLQAQRDRLAAVRRSRVFTQPQKALLHQPAERLDRLAEQLGFRMQQRIARVNERKLRLDRALQRFNPREQALLANNRQSAAEHRLRQSMLTLLQRKQAGWSALLRQLDALSPLKVMQRGYSLVYDEQQKKLIKSVGEVQLGDLLKVRLSDGSVNCHVWSMEENSDDERRSNAKL